MDTNEYVEDFKGRHGVTPVEYIDYLYKSRRHLINAMSELHKEGRITDEEWKQIMRWQSQFWESTFPEFYP